MKQKIAVKVRMKCKKCKSKAMKKAAHAPGVSSVAIDGDKVVVIGVAVDAVKLAKYLRKNFGFAVIECVEEIITSGYVVNPRIHVYGSPALLF